MVTEEIMINGMHCEACEKTIRKSLGKIGVSVDNISYRNGRARITYGDIPEEDIRRALSDKGYSMYEEGEEAEESDAEQEYEEEERAPQPIVQKSRIDRKAYAAEKKILSDGFLTLGILLAVQAILAVGIYSLFDGYKTKYLALMLYLPIAIVVNIIALWHHHAYKGTVSCMTGMMIGMTIGMTTGFMVGAIVGLTNGMFVGSVVGTLAGLVAGVYGGRCCGVMGVMEGMMAGLMSGTMGAMLTVMMITDHVMWFIPILFAICIAILAGLMKAIIQEHEGTDIQVKPWPLTSVLAISFALTLLISLVIIWAPKGLY